MGGGGISPYHVVRSGRARGRRKQGAQAHKKAGEEYWEPGRNAYWAEATDPLAGDRQKGSPPPTKSGKCASGVGKIALLNQYSGKSSVDHLREVSPNHHSKWDSAGREQNGRVRLLQDQKDEESKFAEALHRRKE